MLAYFKKRDKIRYWREAYVGAKRALKEMSACFDQMKSAGINSTAKAYKIIETRIDLLEIELNTCKAELEKLGENVTE